MGRRLEYRNQNTAGNPPRLPSTPGASEDLKGIRWNDTAGAWEYVSISGGGGGNTLDQAYDQGGAGAGRIIVADSGPVAITSSGLVIGATAFSATESLRVVGDSRIEGDVLISGDRTVLPSVPNTTIFGSDLLPFKRVRAQEVVSGDLVMQHPRLPWRWRFAESDDGSGIDVVEETTGRRFRLALVERD